MTNSDLGLESTQHLLFRFGFVCYAAADGEYNDETWVAIRQTWSKIQLGEFIIQWHRETQLSYKSHHDKHTVLIGDAFIVGEGDPLALAAGASDDELLELLDRLSGRFVLIIIQGDAGKIFHDAFGARSVFYKANGAFGIASHSCLLACAFGAKPIVDTLLATLTTMPGDVTMFREVYALPPNHCYDIATQKPVRYWPRKLKRKANFEEFFFAFDAYLKALIEFARPRQPIISLTGGIDSRLIVAAFHYYGVEFSTVTFTNFHFEPWEADPVAKVSRYLGVPHNEINESNDIVDAATRIGVRNSGLYKSKRPAVVAGMRRVYANFPNAIWVTGLGAAVIRGFYNLKGNPMRDLSAAEMARVFVEGGMSDEKPTLDADVESAILSAFEGLRERAGYDRFDGHTFDVNDIFYWEHRVGIGVSAGFNETDVAIPSLLGFNSRLVCEAAYGLSDDERLSKELFLNVMQRYDPKIAAVPFWPTSPLPR